MSATFIPGAPRGEGRDVSSTPLPADAATRATSSAPRRAPASLVRRAVFPVALAAVLVGGFFIVGPGATGSPEERLAAMTPAFGGGEAAAMPAGASDVEREIAESFETVRRSPESVSAYVALGNAYVQNVRERGDPRDYTRAEAAFAEALEREPDNVDALVGQGALALARHDFADALEIGERARALAPGTARVYGVIVDAQTELGRYDEALASAQAMVDLRPDLASYSRVSYQRELHGQLDGAIAAMRQAFDSSAGARPENREYLRVLLGDLYLRSGDLETAERAYTASLGVMPGFVWARVGQARVQAARGHWDAAIAGYQGVVDALPLPEFVVALGETQEAAGRTREAARTYELARAIQALFEANGVDVDLDLALFEADHGDDPRAAVDLARRAYASQPNVKAADALGWALYQDGSYDEARRYAEEALRLGTPYGLFLYHAGMIARAQGDQDAARAYLTRALDVDPYFSPLHAPRARAALDELGA